MREGIANRLLETLRAGVAQLSDEAVAAVKEFVKLQQRDNAAFVNKRGEVDLYYTSFGWSLCLALGIEVNAQKSQAFLKGINPDELDLVHYAAYVQCRLTLKLLLEERMGLILEVMGWRKRRALEEFDRVPHQDVNAPYSQYIWLLVNEMCGREINKKRERLALLNEYRVAEGGYLNNKGGITPTLNATAAALAVRGELAGYRVDEDVTWLQGVQHHSGGFTATATTPIADLLSTATALFTLKCYEVKPRYAAAEFVEAHWLPSGGFSATLFEEESDVEYTFYGLLALGAATA